MQAAKLGEPFVTLMKKQVRLSVRPELPPRLIRRATIAAMDAEKTARARANSGSAANLAKLIRADDLLSQKARMFPT